MILSRNNDDMSGKNSNVAQTLLLHTVTLILKHKGMYFQFCSSP